MSSSSLSKLLTAPRALFLRYTILPCSAPQAFSLSATRVTQYEYTHLFLFHIVCSVSADSVTDGGRGPTRPSFISFYHCYLWRRVASRRVGISPLSSKCDACLSAPQHLLFFLHSSTRFEVKLRVRNLSSSSPPFSCADQGETDWWRAGTAGRQARRTRTNVFTTLQPSRRLENTTGGRTIVPAERLTLSRSPPSLPPCPVFLRLRRDDVKICMKVFMCA